MTCNPTTPGTGRWTCETCGADLGDGTAPYLVRMCAGAAATPMQALARSIRADAATRPPDVARDWVRAVESIVDDTDTPPPVPIDELSDMIREDGGLDETPALALLDEIQRLRAALKRGSE